MAQSGGATDQFPNQLFVATPRMSCPFTPSKCRSAVQSELGLARSRLPPPVGRTTTNHASCPTAQVGAYGHTTKAVTGAQYADIRKPHGTLVNLASRLLSWAKITHMGGACGFKMTCKGILYGQVNPLQYPVTYDLAALRFLQGIAAGLMLDTTSLALLEGRPETVGNRALCDWKTPSPGAAYSEPTSTATAPAAKKRQGKAGPDYHQVTNNGGLLK